MDNPTVGVTTYPSLGRAKVFVKSSAVQQEEQLGGPAHCLNGNLSSRSMKVPVWIVSLPDFWKLNSILLLGARPMWFSGSVMMYLSRGSFCSSAKVSMIFPRERDHLA